MIILEKRNVNNKLTDSHAYLELLRYDIFKGYRHRLKMSVAEKAIFPLICNWACTAINPYYTETVPFFDMEAKSPKEVYVKFPSVITKSLCRGDYRLVHKSETEEDLRGLEVVFDVSKSIGGQDAEGKMANLLHLSDRSVNIGYMIDTVHIDDLFSIKKESRGFAGERHASVCLWKPSQRVSITAISLYFYEAFGLVINWPTVISFIESSCRLASLLLGSREFWKYSCVFYEELYSIHGTALSLASSLIGMHSTEISHGLFLSGYGIGNHLESSCLAPSQTATKLRPIALLINMISDYPIYYLRRKTSKSENIISQSESSVVLVQDPSECCSRTLDQIRSQLESRVLVIVDSNLDYDTRNCPVSAELRHTRDRLLDLLNLICRLGANMLSIKVAGHPIRGYTESVFTDLSELSTSNGLLPPERIAMDTITTTDPGLVNHVFLIFTETSTWADILDSKGARLILVGSFPIFKLIEMMLARNIL